MLKYKPKQFWEMIKATHTKNTDVPTEAIAKLNRNIFFNPDIPDA